MNRRVFICKDIIYSLHDSVILPNANRRDWNGNAIDRFNKIPRVSYMFNPDINTREIIWLVLECR